jgi:hypothetical protein
MVCGVDKREGKVTRASTHTVKLRLEPLAPRVPFREKVECRTIGFPSFVDISTTDTRKLNIEAVIDPDSGKGPPELALKIKPGEPSPRDPNGWAGVFWRGDIRVRFLGRSCCSNAY